MTGSTLLRREKRQSSGGRLDVLLTNPDDDAMYEVEVMLGATDETHIIRAIEYWDLERRRWPQRRHCAVIAAEKITRRFFNVIQLFSQSIPLIAIQASIVEADGKRALHFTKVLDEYAEPELDVPDSTPGDYEKSWAEHAPWTVECAHSFVQGLSVPLPGLRVAYLKNYLSLRFRPDGVGYFWLYKRSAGQSQIWFEIDETGWNEAESLLNDQGVQYLRRQEKGRIIATSAWIREHTDFVAKLGRIVKAAIHRWNPSEAQP